MEIINALQTAQLATSVIDNNLQKYVELINTYVKPPVPVGGDDVLIRAMYIVSDSVNAYGGRFDRADLPNLAKLFVDSPVLIGHDKAGLPVARTFWAETVEKDGQLWVKSYFYWLKQAEGANRLKLNIDSGIYKECSVSFTYSHPECSACGKDIRFCGHKLSGEVFFYYRGIEKVLETSLVYRGAVTGTSITNKLCYSSTQGESDNIPNTIFTLQPIAELGRGFSMAAKQAGFKARLGGYDFLLSAAKEHSNAI